MTDGNNTRVPDRFDLIEQRIDALEKDSHPPIDLEARIREILRIPSESEGFTTYTTYCFKGENRGDTVHISPCAKGIVITVYDAHAGAACSVVIPSDSFGDVARALFLSSKYGKEV